VKWRVASKELPPQVPFGFQGTAATSSFRLCPAPGRALTLLKNSFQRFPQQKFVRKLLMVRSLRALKFAEITALVPFSTPTPVLDS
jgi:hypothetical protein